MSIFSGIGREFSDGWGDIKNAFSSKNTKDPVAHVGAKLSVDPITRALSDKVSDGGFSHAWDNMQTRVPDRVNFNAGSVINGEGAPGISSGFGKEAQVGDFDGHGTGGWIMNKPATTIGALITAGEFAGGAFGGGTPTTPTTPTAPVAPTTPATPTTPTAPQGMDWQQYMQMAQQMQGGQGQQGAPQQQQQPPVAPLIPPPPAVVPTAPAANPAQLARSRQDASLNPSIGQLLSNFGGGGY